MIKIAIVDDHILFRKGVASLLKSDKLFNVTMEADNGKDFIDKISNAKENETPDVLLLDINMPVMDGYQTAEWLRKTRPQIKVIALTMIDKEDSIIKMLKLGAKAYLLKYFEAEELFRAIKTVLANGFYYNEFVSQKLILALSKGDDNKDDKVSLTDREIELLQLCTTELTYREIAEKMSISPRTVDAFRDSLFEKLNVKTRVGLAMYAVRNKII